MRKGQLIRMVLKAYKHHIKYLRENFQDKSRNEIHRYLSDHGLQNGVCYYIFRNVTENCGHNNAYGANWVKKYYTYGNVWGNYPGGLYALEYTLELLQLRVDNLEKELASGDKLHQRITSKNYSNG